MRSPIYCDTRKTLSHPEIRRFIRDSFEGLIRENFGVPDIIAGIATGAIAHAALVAEKMDLPLVYVRAEPKSHGMGNRIEGEAAAGRAVIVIEDLVSTGGSSLAAVSALRDAGLEVLGMAAIFSYGFPVAEQNFREAGIRLLTLGNYADLIRAAAGTGYIREEDLETLGSWRENPAGWHTNKS